MLLCCAVSAQAFPAEVLRSVVSVQPQQPPGGPPRRGAAPEGTGVVIAPGIVATAAHVLGASQEVLLRLSDGRVLPADRLATDEATDIALLSLSAPLPTLGLARDAGLGDPVCAVGNNYGLGLSVTCGVVSALGVTDAGFNAIEHFVQTDAAINPGASGGALVDAQGRLVGLISAIFASQGDSNVGMNFAVSAALLDRVTAQLLAEGAVRVPRAGWQLVPADRATLARVAAPVIGRVAPGSPADRAGLRAGDLLLAVADIRVRSGRDALAQMALLPLGAAEVPVRVERDGTVLDVLMPLLEPQNTAQPAPPVGDAECPHPAPVCRMRQAVFPISAFDPVGSATRIGTDLLVTNRHVIGDFDTATVFTPDGPRAARVVPSAYRGDLVLLQIDGLPNGHVPDLEVQADIGPTQVVGADVNRGEVRVFAPGAWLSGPAGQAPLGRVHVAAPMQPGVSGGALVDAEGRLVGIAVGGGEGRYEAIPLAQVQRLLALRAAPDAAEVTAMLGAAFVACADGLEGARGAPAAPDLQQVCAQADNPGQLLEAGRVLARAGAFDGSAALMEQAVAQVPNSLNARLSLLVALQLGARFEEMIPHARFVLERAGDDAGALRFAIQAGVWGGDLALAEAGYTALSRADPAQAQAARRFIDSAPPAPPRR